MTPEQIDAQVAAFAKTLEPQTYTSDTLAYILLQEAIENGTVIVLPGEEPVTGKALYHRVVTEPTR